MKQYLDFSTGVAIGLFIGFVFGFIGMIWAVSEPIYCGDKPCVEVRSESH